MLTALAIGLILLGLAGLQFVTRRAIARPTESTSEAVLEVGGLLAGAGVDSLLLPIPIVLAGIGLLASELGWF